MRLVKPSEEMLVRVFVKGFRVNLFDEYLLRSPSTMLTKIRGWVTIHIETEEVMQRKQAEERRPLAEHKSREQRCQVMEVFSPRKRTEHKYSPYATQ